MIFTKITLENYGVFRGVHNFNLLPESNSKPIVLLGGKNGSGKTTLFEAVRLCLYGAAIQGSVMPSNKYEKFLRDKIHRHTGIVIQPDNASVTLEFKYVQFGKVDRYSVKRYWRFVESKVKESLEIFKNAQLLSDVETDQWQNFVKELIPPGVTKLFFFDGEQIQNLAEDGNIHLRDSFDSLVGLDVIERLSLDLRYVVSRMRKQSEGETEEQITQLYGQHDDLKKKLDEVETNISQIENRIQYLRGQVQKQEQLISSEGGGYASKRQELKAKKESLDGEIKAIEVAIRELSSALLPFAVTPHYCIKLRDQIRAEEEFQEQSAARKSMQKKLIELRDKISADEFWSDVRINDSDRIKVLGKMSKSIESVIEETDLSKVKIIHNMSPPERQKLLVWISEVLSKTHLQIKELSQNLERRTRERQEIEKLLMRSPPDEVLHPFIQELNRLYAEVGAEEQKLQHGNEAKRQVQFKIGEIVSKLYKEYDRQEEGQDQSVKEELAKKTQKLLNEYLVRVREQKLKQLEENLVLSLNHLSHKKMFETVRIDPRDFTVVLYDINGNEIPKEQLSAGEKQIYAIAMLWALARTSGRPLPFIIDTPLGRLDSDHRTNLVVNFFPLASHQVIVFSTDTEIDEKYFEELEPYISQAYHIEYERKQGMSGATPGYFWKSKRRKEIEV